MCIFHSYLLHPSLLAQVIPVEPHELTILFAHQFENDEMGIHPTSGCNEPIDYCNSKNKIVFKVKLLV
jgi:hypothetical protein